MRSPFGPAAPGQRTIRPRDAVCLLAAIVVLAVHVRPAFFPVDVEGFSYFSDSLAIAINDGFVLTIDRLWRFNTEFFYYTRPGTIWILSLTKSLFAGATYKDVVPFFSFVTIVTSIVFVRRWTNAPWWIAAISLCFFPIVIEAAFFTNDNMIALAFTMAAFALLVTRPGAACVFAAGVLISVAVLVRLDQVFNIGIAGLVILKFCDSWKQLAQRCLWFGVGLVLAQLGFHLVEMAAGLPPSDLLTRISVSRHGIALWERSRGMALDVVRDLTRLAIAVGPGIVPIAIGASVVLTNAFANVTRRPASPFDRLKALSDPGIYFAFPAVFYAASLGKYYDPRGFLIFAPIALALAAFGLNAICDLSTAGGRPPARRALGFGLVALALLLLFVPTPYHRQLSAPESPDIGLTGRIWAYPAWRGWQDGREAPGALSRRVVEEAASRERPVAIAVGEWTYDRAAQNALALSGYAPVPATGSACAAAAETWGKDDRSVTLVRWHPPFGGVAGRFRNPAVVYLAGALPCLRGFEPDDRLVTGLGPFTLAPDAAGGTRDAGAIRTLSDTDLASLEAQALGFVGCTTVEACGFLGARLAELERRVAPRVLDEHE